MTQIIYFEPGLKPVIKFNPNHDDKGRFASDGSNEGFSFIQDKYSMTMQDKTGKTLASIDYVNLGFNKLDINSIDSYDGGKGYATKILDNLYASFPEHSIFWGKTIVPASTHLAEKFASKYGRTTYIPWGEGAINGKEMGKLYGQKEPVEKFNPNHDEVGRFASSTAGTSGASTFTAGYKGFTLSGDETSALNSYLGNGYKNMNGILRGDIPTSDSTKLYEMNIEEMDKTIARAPIVQSEAPIYRVFNAYNVTHLKPGETYIDKGFMSTTLADISSKKGASVRSHLGDISETMDVVARIKPNGHYSGLSVNHADKDLAAFPKEQEFILPRGTQLKYLGFEKASSGETIMNFERMNG